MTASAGLSRERRGDEPAEPIADDDPHQLADSTPGARQRPAALKRQAAEPAAPIVGGEPRQLDQREGLCRYRRRSPPIGAFIEEVYTAKRVRGANPARGRSQ